LHNRIRNTQSDGSYWIYEYDPLGQVRAGRKYWADGSPVSGQQFEYGFDDIGNRRNAKAGGDENGANLRSATYTPNNLNQYTSRTVPGAADVMGVAIASNGVTVAGLPAYRKAEYFRKEVPVNNTSAGVWTNLVVSTAGENPVSGKVFVPQTPESFTHDADGNLTADGRFNYSWDAENRLVKVESLASSPTASKRRVTWEFDGKSRRIRQTTYDGSSGTYVLTEDLKFVSDGWRHVAELNAANNSLVRSYLWGLDLSGSLDGAGGVGGLLLVNSAANGTHFTCYDGNGNVSALVSAQGTTVTARYEYGPFGEPLRITGFMAKENPFRFSTKRANDTTDLVLYEYRIYSSGTGRWNGRDPMGRKSDSNLYAFVRNASAVAFDPDGRITVSVITTKPKTCCGSADVYFNFVLDSPAAEDGYIVQENVADVPWVSCSEIVHGNIWNDHYWEAWEVKKGQTSPEGPYTDHVFWPPQKSAIGGGGIDGTIKFFFKSHRGVGDLSDWTTKISSPASLDLPSTRSRPDWWNDPSDNGENHASRSVHTVWDCCCPQDVSFITVDPGGITHWEHCK
jgi:RHS repeat-associated protein